MEDLHFATEDHSRAGRVQCGAFLKEVEGNSVIINDNHSLAEDGDGANGTCEYRGLSTATNRTALCCNLKLNNPDVPYRSLCFSQWTHSCTPGGGRSFMLPTMGFGFGPGGRGAGVFLGVRRTFTMYRPSPPRTMSIMSRELIVTGG